MARILSAFFSVVLMATSAGASTIAWGPATDTTGPSDVFNAGELVKAVNLGGDAVTVNGVPFERERDEIPFKGFFQNAVFSGGADLGDPDFTNLLNTAAWTYDNEPSDITLTGLTPGITYGLQLFFMDQRGCCTHRQLTATSGANQVTLEADPGSDLGGPFGQFTIGTFVADASMQGFRISGVGAIQINAWQLRAIPEPGSLLLVGSGVALLAQRRRGASKA